MKRLNITPNQRYPLKANGTWKPSVHVFDTRTINALNAAWLAERPLLVRGDPGTGKSQLARAAAEALNWQLVSEVVNAQTDIQDLWYRFDAISRLGQAQLLSALAGADWVTKDSLKTELDPKKFLSPAALWWAYDWQTAQTYYNESEAKLYHPNADRQLADKPDYDPKTDHPKGVVLLIDEIDKADADLPNSLLETLDNARFRIPWVNESIGFNRDDDNAVRPLVIITTNEDRQLPAAFVRRCLVLNLALPDDKSELIRYLTQRGKEHYQDDDGQCVLDERVLH